MKTIKNIILFLVALYFVTIPADYIRHASQSEYEGERAPYLQSLGQNQVIIRWQTSTPKQTILHFGNDAKQLSAYVHDKVSKTEHTVYIRDLQPMTEYFYQVPNSSLISTPVSFYTAPKKGSDKPIRVWVQGDAGRYSDKAEKNFANIKSLLKSRPASLGPDLDLWLTTGDNAYKSGKASEYQQHVFEPYQEWMAQYSYWPVYGNHDARRHTYDDIFTFPEQGELGGVASENGRYMSFDYGQLHVIFLDSTTTHLYRHYKMAKWLEADLQQNTLPWTIVLFHEPPYTRGSHDSDSWIDSVGRMITMREKIAPILEKYSVDLVMSGHSHVYERSNLIRCHYQDSHTFNEQMNIQAGHHFTKTDDLSKARQGTVYQLIGSTAKIDKNPPLDHPAMPHAFAQSGAVFIEIAGDKLVSQFINEEGEVVDKFEIVKQDQVPITETCDLM